MRLVALAVVVATAWAAWPTGAQTFLSGELPSALDASGNPHIAISALTLTDGSCTIGSGVELNFTEGTSVELRGPGLSSLHVLGTSASPVVFQGWLGERWDGVRVVQPGSADLNVQHLLMHGGDLGITILVSPVTYTAQITDTVIDESGSKGIGLGGTGTAIIHDVTIEDRSTGLFLSGASSASIERCVVRDCGTGVQVGSSLAAVTECSAFDCFKGFHLGGSATASMLLGEGCVEGAVLDSNEGTGPTLLASVFQQNSTGLRVIGTGPGPSTATGVLVSDNSFRGVEIDGPSVINDCEIHSNGNYDVYVQSAILDVEVIDMRNCYWGSATTLEMLSEGTFTDIEALFDFWDDSSRSIVNFEDFVVPVSAPEGSWVEASLGSVKGRYRAH